MTLWGQRARVWWWLAPPPDRQADRTRHQLAMRQLREAITRHERAIRNAEDQLVRIGPSLSPRPYEDDV